MKSVSSRDGEMPQVTYIPLSEDAMRDFRQTWDKVHREAPVHAAIRAAQEAWREVEKELAKLNEGDCFNPLLKQRCALFVKRVQFAITARRAAGLKGNTAMVQQLRALKKMIKAEIERST